MKKHIPNLLTILNLLSGVIAIEMAVEGKLTYAAYLIFLGAFFDFFDGASARLLKVSSDIGKQLDSLADMVTFGVAPAFICFNLMSTHSGIGYFHLTALLIPAMSALRLARFNIDERQTSSFLGLPTPAHGFFWAGLTFVEHSLYSRFPLVLAIYAVVMSLLLVSEIPMFSLKFKHLKWRGNEVRFIFLIVSATLIAILYFSAVPIIVFLYIVFSIINNLVSKKNEIQS